MFRHSDKKQNIQLRLRVFQLFIILMPALCFAGLQDPTKPDYPKSTAITNDSPQADEKLELSAIWITATCKWAFINGVTVREGQTLSNNIKIIKITRKTVSLRQHGSIKILQLLPPLSKFSEF